MKGYLMKKTSRKIFGWVKRYGCVSNKKFRYYSDKSMINLRGVFDFDKINCLIMIDEGEDNKNKEY